MHRAFYRHTLMRHSIPHPPPNQAQGILLTRMFNGLQVIVHFPAANSRLEGVPSGAMMPARLPRSSSEPRVQDLDKTTEMKDGAHNDSGLPPRPAGNPGANRWLL